MDDLAGLDWSAPSTQKSPLNTSANILPHRQNPTPQLSGRSTPLSAQQSGASAANRPLRVPSKPATPANDSFAGLISRNSSKSAQSNLTLQERQRQLQEEKAKQEAERRKQFDSHFKGDSQFWDTPGSGKSTPEPTTSGLQRPATGSSRGANLSQTINKPFAGLDTSSKRPVVSSPAEDDLLSAFNSGAPVDSSSHFPPPRSYSTDLNNRSHGTPIQRESSPLPQPSATSAFDDDDDMFGLKQLAKNSGPSATHVATEAHEGDDILGLLGKPVSEFQRKPEPVVEDSLHIRGNSPDMDNPQARAVAELVDMGFSADQSAIALATTESGLDVQAAVGYILNQAHAQAKQKTRAHPDERPTHSPDGHHERPTRSNTHSRTRESRTATSKPAWMHEDNERSRSGQRRQEAQSVAQEKDVTQLASEIGNSLFKSANSLWKTGRKQVQKAVAELQQDGDPNVPKWMKSATNVEEGEREAQPSRPRRDPPSGATAGVTDEVMLLESGGRPTKPSRPSESRRTADAHVLPQTREHERARNGVSTRELSQSPAPRQSTPVLDKRPAARLTREEVEAEAARSYVSSSRRRKATPQPDLLAQEQSLPSQPTARQPTPSQSNNPFLKATSAPKPRSPAAPSPAPRPRAPPRQIPPASSSALNSSASYRQKGSEAFKRGDYTAAHAAYTSAVGPLPSTHPVMIVVLCNRAVTNIKVGDPKAAVSDADAALAIIGVSKGDGEKIALGGTEGEKDMKEFYGKALMRKAEALEAMEKWDEAGKIWRTAVEDGVGGSISIQGRNRCDKATGKGAAVPAVAKRPPVRKAPPKTSALADLGGGPATDSEAVKKLKAANAAAEKADDEKFALTDQVDAKLVAWKGTKADNLRALLGSLDKVLWPEAGWKKVNMGDLVMPNKVKIIYMKAIAKVHPDKIPQNATVEQRMVSAAVFATLNEAWDKFKTDNGM